MNTKTEQHTTWESTEPAMQEVLNTARVVAAAGVTTLIMGESGSGREWLARAIHTASSRHAAPFVALNCGALPPAQADALIFGPFRGGHGLPAEMREGYLCAAAGGTLFLDDIGELRPDVQTRLLHYLESGEVITAGGALQRSVDVRIVAGSHRNLGQSVEEGRFRAELYYRLRVVPLTLPPLRERRRDIAPLADRFLAELAAQHGVPAVHLDAAARQRLSRQPWPGNVRELRNLCERLTLLLPGQVIGVDNLPQEYRATQPRGSRVVALPSTGLNLAELERDLITQALERTGGNRSRAARLLGLTRDTLLYRLKKFALA